MHLDTYTLLAAGSAALVLQGCLFLFFWPRDRSATWLLCWGIAFAIGGISLPLYMLANWQTDIASISVGNAVRIIAFGLLWQGLRLFHGRRLQPWPLLLPAAAWVVLCFYPPFMDSMTARVILGSVICGAYCALAAYELWRHAEPLPSRRPLMIVLGSFSVMMLCRVFAARTTPVPFPMGAAAVDANWLASFMLIVIAHAAFAALLFFSMTRERSEAEQRSYALSDPLTGLLNRRAFADFAARMNRRSGQRGAMALLALDLDHFKSINDRFGHEAGDRMLKAFADVAEANVRPSDQLFRMGGEEFCVTLPETTQAEAIAVAERIRRAFEAIVLEADAEPVHGTVSIGIAATQFSMSVDVLLAAADAALYEAKTRGRNRVVVAEPSALLRGMAEAPSRLRA